MFFGKTLSARRKRFSSALSSTGTNIAVQTAKEVHIGRLPPASLVYWLRLGFGVLAGTIYNLTGFGSLGVGLGTLSMITVGIGVYSVSIFLVKNLLGYGPEVLKGPNKHVTIGMGSYVIWMIFTTILLNTVLNPYPSKQIPSSPPRPEALRRQQGMD